eukprot:g76886.t1
MPSLEHHTYNRSIAIVVCAYNEKYDDFGNDTRLAERELQPSGPSGIGAPVDQLDSFLEDTIPSDDQFFGKSDCHGNFKQVVVNPSSESVKLNQALIHLLGGNFDTNMGGEEELEQHQRRQQTGPTDEERIEDLTSHFRQKFQDLMTLNLQCKSLQSEISTDTSALDDKKMDIAKTLEQPQQQQDQQPQDQQQQQQQQLPAASATVAQQSDQAQAAKGTGVRKKKAQAQLSMDKFMIPGEGVWRRLQKDVAGCSSPRERVSNTSAYPSSHATSSTPPSSSSNSQHSKGRTVPPFSKKIPTTGAAQTYTRLMSEFKPEDYKGVCQVRSESTSNSRLPSSFRPSGGHLRREEGRNCGGSRGCSVAGCFVLLMVSFLVLAFFQDPDSIQELTRDHTHNTTSVFDRYLRKTRSTAKEFCGVEWFWALITFVYGGLLVLGYRRRRRVLRMFALALFGFVSAECTFRTFNDLITKAEKRDGDNLYRYDAVTGIVKRFWQLAGVAGGLNSTKKNRPGDNGCNRCSLKDNLRYYRNW